MSAVEWKDWNPRRFKDDVKELVAERMERVGTTVEQQAKRNLIAIQWRPRFKAYRQKLLTRLLAHEIETGDDFVECRVGILNPPGTTHSKAGYEIEVGTSEGRAQPWLRPALFNNAREILRIIAGK